MIKAIIVEDDFSHSNTLKNFLHKFDMPIKVVAVTTSVETTVDAIKIYNPDLVFLDIELEGGQTGFDLLNLVDKSNFDIIFTTSHIDNNIREIRLCAVDYIVKPYILTEVKEVLVKYLSDHEPGFMKERLNSLRVNILPGDIDQKAIYIPDKSIYIQVKVGHILFCEADNEYTHFYLVGTDGKPERLVSSKGLGKWEEELTGYNFCRISRKYLINIKHMARFYKNEDKVELTNGRLLDVSQSGKDALLKIIKR